MDDGFSILNTNLINKLTCQVETQTGGEFFRTNPHTTRFAYWYQFQTTACYYNFDVPKKILKLERFDCKDKEIRAANIVLRKN